MTEYKGPYLILFKIELYENKFNFLSYNVQK